MSKLMWLLALVPMVACAPHAPSEVVTSGVDSNLDHAAVIGGSFVSADSAIARSTVRIGRNDKFSCTGTLLSESEAITAAHCLDTRYNGRPSGDFAIAFPGAGTRAITSFELHPHWVPSLKRLAVPGRFDQDGDVALVRFDGGLPHGFSPANVLDASHELRAGDLVTVAGFGMHDATGNSEATDGRLRSAEIPIEVVRKDHYEVQLDQRGPRGACRGDSGGPVFIKHEGEYKMWGVISRVTLYGPRSEQACHRATIVSRGTSFPFRGAAR